MLSVILSPSNDAITGEEKHAGEGRTGYLLRQERRLVGAVCGLVPGAPHGLHVRDGHAQDGELVWLPGQRAARGDHVRELGDVLGHLVPPPPFNLTVVLSSRKHEIRGGGKRRIRLGVTV